MEDAPERQKFTKENEVVRQAVETKQKRELSSRQKRTNGKRMIKLPTLESLLSSH